MDELKLKAVEIEIERLRKRIAELKKTPKSCDSGWWGSKQTAAVRRASMDLTRALSNLRSP